MADVVILCPKCEHAITCHVAGTCFPTTTTKFCGCSMSQAQIARNVVGTLRMHLGETERKLTERTDQLEAFAHLTAQLGKYHDDPEYLDGDGKWVNIVDQMCAILDDKKGKNDASIQ